MTALLKGFKLQAVLALTTYGLPRSAITVGCYLIDHFNLQTGRSDPSISLLSRETGIPERMVKYAVKALGRTGWFEVRRRGKNSGGRATNSYTPNFERFAAMRADLEAIRTDWKEQRQRGKEFHQREGGNEPTKSATDCTRRMQGVALKGCDGLPPKQEIEPIKGTLEDSGASNYASASLGYKQIEDTGETATVINSTSDTEPIANATPLHSMEARKPNGDAKLAYSEAAETPRRESSQPIPLTVNDEGKRRRQAEKQFYADLLGTGPKVYVRAVEVMTPELTEAAIAAELAKRGAGVRMVLEAAA